MFSLGTKKKPPLLGRLFVLEGKVCRGKMDCYLECLSAEDHESNMEFLALHETLSECWIDEGDHEPH